MQINGSGAGVGQLTNRYRLPLHRPTQSPLHPCAFHARPHDVVYGLEDVMVRRHISSRIGLLSEERQQIPRKTMKVCYQNGTRFWLVSVFGLVGKKQEH